MVLLRIHSCLCGSPPFLTIHPVFEQHMYSSRFAPLFTPRFLTADRQSSSQTGITMHARQRQRIVKKKWEACSATLFLQNSVAFLLRWGVRCQCMRIRHHRAKQWWAVQWEARCYLPPTPHTFTPQRAIETQKGQRRNYCTHTLFYFHDKSALHSSAVIPFRIQFGVRTHFTVHHLGTFTIIYHLLVRFTFTFIIRTMVVRRSQTGITMHIRHKIIQTRGVRCRNAQFYHHSTPLTAQQK